MAKGGGKETFCACFASRGANDADGLKYSVEILYKIADKTLVAKNDLAPYSSLQGMEYLTTFVKTATAVRSCASDQQHIFASKEDVTKWCNAQPERSAGFICQHRPL